MHYKIYWHGILLKFLHVFLKLVLELILVKNISILKYL